MGPRHALGSEQGSESEREVVRLQDGNRERESAEVAEKLRPERGMVVSRVLSMVEAHQENSRLL